MAKKSRFWASVALLWTMLMPSIAQADVGEGYFLSFAKGIWVKVQPSLMPYYAMEGELGVWRYVLSALVTSLTLTWLWRWKPRGYDVTNLVGKTVGPFALVGFVMAVGWMIVGTAIGIIQGAIAGATMSAIVKIPIIGWFVKDSESLKSGINNLVTTVLGIIFAIGFLIYLWNNKGSLVQQVFDVIKGIFQGAGGSEVGMKYKIPGTLAATAIINRLELNAPILYTMTGASCLLGLYTLWTTDAVRGLTGRATAYMASRPLSDGRWHCHKCQRLNEASHEACAKCGAKNPYLSWDCENAKDHNLDTDGKPIKDGKVGFGIAWNNHRCPKCGKERSKKAAAARATPPSKGDKVNAAAKATTRYRIADPASPPTTATAAAAPTGSAAAPTTPCPHCGEQNRPQAVFCRKCRGKMGERSLADEALDEPFARN